MNAYVDRESDPGSWLERLRIEWLGKRYRVEERPAVEDFDTAEGGHVHVEQTGEYEQITEWCDEPEKGSKG